MTNGKPAEKKATIEVRPRGKIVDWLSSVGGSLLVSTYNSGKLVAISVAEGKLTTQVWKFARPMGLAVHGRPATRETPAKTSLALAAREHLWLYESCGDGDARFTLATKYPTRRLDMHDVAFGRRGIYFVNTKFNCLARPSERLSFLKTWHPWFISEIKPRDRCHLNGMGMREGRPAMATAFAECDAVRGWRKLDRFSSGVVIDVRENKTVVRGLSMPHSPRWHQRQWWVCNSGEGALCRFDSESGTTVRVAELPGFTRGLCFLRNWAVVGLSKVREQHILDTPGLRARQNEVHAGVAVVDTQTGQYIGGIEFVRGGSEVYEVAHLPQVTTLDLQQG